jgi:hypothetical protein
MIFEMEPVNRTTSYMTLPLQYSHLLPQNSWHKLRSYLRWLHGLVYATKHEVLMVKTCVNTLHFLSILIFYFMLPSKLHLQLLGTEEENKRNFYNVEHKYTKFDYTEQFNLKNWRSKVVQLWPVLIPWLFTTSLKMDRKVLYWLSENKIKIPHWQNRFKGNCPPHWGQQPWGGSQVPHPLMWYITWLARPITGRE